MCDSFVITWVSSSMTKRQHYIVRGFCPKKERELVADAYMAFELVLTYSR
jgi:hypothetical protein